MLLLGLKGVKYGLVIWSEREKRLGETVVRVEGIIKKWTGSIEWQREKLWFCWC